MRAPYLYNRRVTDAEYRQRVKKYRPSALVPLIAAASAQYSLPHLWMASPCIKLMPWALADVARVSITQGNEHRASIASDDDVMKCCAAYMGMTDPDLFRMQNVDALAKFMLRMSSEQLSYYSRPFNEFSRTIALFDQTSVTQELRVLADAWYQDLFGCTVAEYVGTAFLLQVGALVNQGHFSLSWLDQENFASVRAQVPGEVLKQVATEQFIASVEDIRAGERPFPRDLHPGLRRYTFNPLQATPVVSGLSDDLLVPVTNLLVKKSSPSGLYYTGVGRWGNKFAEDVGVLFEAYVGRNLKLIDDVRVIPEITYGHEKRKSVDWLVVLDKAVLLVEVKSTRPTEAVRVASQEAATSIRKSLHRAVEQIDNTAQLIRERHSDFSEIPHDRPIFGLVVTMEPFHVVNAQPYQDLLGSCSVPFKVCSAHDLEKLVTVDDVNVERVLLEKFASDQHRDSAVDQLIEGCRFKRHAVLDAAWRTLPWQPLDVSEFSVLEDAETSHGGPGTA